MNKCKISKCNHKLFTDEHCIFHCKKDSWYSTENKYKRWNRNLVNEFWKEFNSYIINSKNCTEFIFPTFDYYDFENGINEEPTNKYAFYNRQIEGIDFTKSIFMDGFTSDNSKFIDCKFNQCEFQYLQILVSDITDCSFHGSKFKDGYFDGCTIKNTNFQWLNPEYISFLYSRIDDTNFNNSYFKKLSLEHAVVNNATFQNTTIVSGNVYTFRILKNYYQGISDNIKGNYFYSKEMQEYCKDIITEPYYNIKDTIRNLFNYFKYKNKNDARRKNITNSLSSLLLSIKRVFSEGLLLIWNFGVSNFGQNWILPIIWLFISSFTIFIYINDNEIFDINKFAMFLNPFIKNTEQYSEVYAIWLFHKILEAIFIYNFIIAIKRRTTI